jgi:putative flippase GtrA
MAFIFSKIRGSEIVRFVMIGVLNTLVDFAVLNLLLYIFREEGLELYPLLKSISFIVAVTNSYLFNKYWVFLAHSRPTFIESGKFLGANLFGLFLNAGVSSTILFVILAVLGGNMSNIIAANISALSGSLAVAVMNFLFYKHFVFRKMEENNAE